jgi:hypothetical protein
MPGNGNLTVEIYNLTLVNTTLIMTPSADGNANITVKNGGMNVSYGSNVTSNDSGNAYQYVIDADSFFYATDSHFSDIGWGWGTNNTGLNVYTSDILIRNNTFINNFPYSIELLSSATNPANPIESNTFTASVSDQRGIACWYLDNLYFINNIFDGNSIALHNYDCTGSITGGRINATGDGETGVVCEQWDCFEYIKDVDFADSTTHISMDTLLDDNELLRLLNTTAEADKLIFEGAGAGSIQVEWYLDVYVNDTSGADLANVNISLWQENGSLEQYDDTNGTGWTYRFNVTEYVKNDSDTDYFTNYTIWANLSGYYIQSKTLNITDSSWTGSNPLYFTLSPTGCTGTDPPTSGDWIITENTTCQDTTITSHLSIQP